MPDEWNASAYDRVADPQARWGAEVIERLPLAGDETVLDAGCGTGRVTELLLARLPRGRVVALDQSAAMLEGARRRLATFGDRVSYVQADLERPLQIDGQVDAILSTATFHWVMDHDTLFANLATVLRPGGWLVAQCGGFGNIARFIEVATSVDPGFVRNPHNFQTAEATAPGWSGRASRMSAPGCHPSRRASTRGIRSRRSSRPSASGCTWIACRPSSAGRSCAPWRRGCPSRSSTTSA